MHLKFDVIRCNISGQKWWGFITSRFLEKSLVVFRRVLLLRLQPTASNVAEAGLEVQEPLRIRKGRMDGIY